MNQNGHNLKLKTEGYPAGQPDFLRVISNDEETPGISLRLDANALDENSKIELIEKHFGEIMNILGLDLTDDSLRKTPHRVAKMFVKEVFSGLNPDNKPKVTLFENKYNYNQMLVEKDIKVNSYCEHHFVPILGRAHVGYISSGKVIGLSKINRIVDFFSRRPQVQERLTVQIAEELKKVLETEDVAVVIEATHMCVTVRGVEDEHSSTATSSFHGVFKDPDVRKEFFAFIHAPIRTSIN
ncbi:MAG: GTP cyclohydrolase I FolE [Bacteroidales bacterium]|nr:GTP cyclohydrolase I FolE [Bacteroidales bacterium]